MQSKLEVLTTSINKVEEQVTDIEDKLWQGGKLRKKEKQKIMRIG